MCLSAALEINLLLQCGHSVSYIAVARALQSIKPNCTFNKIPIFVKFALPDYSAINLYKLVGLNC